jgi:hypothetical protein
MLIPGIVCLVDATVRCPANRYNRSIWTSTIAVDDSENAFVRRSAGACDGQARLNCLADRR